MQRNLLQNITYWEGDDHNSFLYKQLPDENQKQYGHYYYKILEARNLTKDLTRMTIEEKLDVLNQNFSVICKRDELSYY